METTGAILLRKTKLSETSLIITWWTERFGKLKTVAKGARRPKSSFAGKLDLFFDAEIQFARSHKSELHMLREVAVKNPHEGLRRTLNNLELASYFVELIELVTEPEHAAPELYDLLQRAFRYLSSHSGGKRELLHFESEIARFLGIGTEERSPYQAIGHAYGRLPRLREEILDRLAKQSPP